MEAGLAEGRLLGGALDFDDAAGTGQHEIGVRLGGGVLGVVEVEHRRAARMPQDTAATWPVERRRLRARSSATRCANARRSATQAPVIAAHARAAIGLQHVAVDGDLPLAQRPQVDHGAQGAADQPLDFLRAAGLLAARRLALAARVGGARQHAVFGRHPALRRSRAGTAAPASRRWQRTSTCVSPKRDQARSLGVAGESGGQGHGAQCVGRAAGWAHDRSILRRIGAFSTTRLERPPLVSGPRNKAPAGAGRTGTCAARAGRGNPRSKSVLLRLAPPGGGCKMHYFRQRTGLSAGSARRLDLPEGAKTD